MRREKIQLIRNTLVKRMEELWSNANNTISKMKNGEGSYAIPLIRPQPIPTSLLNWPAGIGKENWCWILRKRLCALTGAYLVFAITVAEPSMKKGFTLNRWADYVRNARRRKKIYHKRKNRTMGREWYFLQSCLMKSFYCSSPAWSRFCSPGLLERFRRKTGRFLPVCRGEKASMLSGLASI